MKGEAGLRGALNAHGRRTGESILERTRRARSGLLSQFGRRLLSSCIVKQRGRGAISERLMVE